MDYQVCASASTIGDSVDAPEGRLVINALRAETEVVRTAKLSAFTSNGQTWGFNAQCNKPHLDQAKRDARIDCYEKRDTSLF
jgi:hypothetical protein